MPKVILHQWDMSPFCNKVRRCLKYKGVDYSIINYNGLAATQAAKLSSVGKLPVLDWDTRPQTVDTSLQIIGYAVDVRIHPISYTWHWGDGSTLTTTTPGRPPTATPPSASP